MRKNMINNYFSFKNILLLHKIYTLIILVLISGLIVWSFSFDNLKKNTIILSIDTTLDSSFFNGFSNMLEKRIYKDLLSYGYDVILNYQDKNSLVANIDSFTNVLKIWKEYKDTLLTIYASVMPFYLYLSQQYDTIYDKLLILPCNFLDQTTALLIISKKISENFRNRYICTIKIKSIPDSAIIKTSTGLYGICPVKWDIAFGIIDISCSKKGYLAKSISLNLNKEKNIDTLTIILNRRMPYHSTFFIPSLSLFTTSLIFFGGEYYYYNKYKNLNEKDLQNNPQVFGNTFNKAKTLEYLAWISGIGFGITFVTSFFF